MNSDCTGTYTVQIAPFGITSQAFFAIDSNGDELEIIVTDPGSVKITNPKPAWAS